MTAQLRRKNLRWLKYVGFLCITVVALLVLAEVAARILICHFAGGDGLLIFGSVDEFNKYGLSRSRMIPHPYLGFVMCPNYRKGGTSINSHGFRGEEFAMPKPANEFRIVCVGGSTTFDDEIDDNAKTCTARLQCYLEQRGYSAKVINAGVPGWSSYESLINFAFRISSVAPDLLIDYDCWNDLSERMMRPENYVGDNSGVRRGFIPSFPWYEQMALVRIAQIQACNNGQEKMMRAQPVSVMLRLTKNFLQFPDNPYYKDMSLADLLEHNPPVYFKRNVANLIAMAQTEGTRTLLLTFAYSRTPKSFQCMCGLDPERKDLVDQYIRAFDGMNTAIKDLGRETNTPVFDLESTFPQPEDYTQYYADGFHSNEAGADLKAQLVADYLVKMAVIPDRYHTGESGTATAAG